MTRVPRPCAFALAAALAASAASGTATAQGIVALAGDGDELVALDGGTLAVQGRRRLPTRIAIPPILLADQDAALVVAPDGRIERTAVPGLAVTAETRLRSRPTGAAASADGRYLLVAADAPSALIVLDARTLALLKEHPARDETRETRIDGLAVAGPRASFLATMTEVPEAWEISYSDSPPYRGWVHDHRDDGPPEQRPRFPLRRIPLKDVLTGAFLDASADHLVAAAAADGRGAVLDLYIGRQVATIDLPGRWAWRASAPWADDRGATMATPSAAAPVLAITDMRRWTVTRHIAIAAPAALLASHPSPGPVWIAGFAPPLADAVQLLDTRDVAVGPPFRPRQGSAVAALAIDRAGTHAIVALGGPDGGVLLLDRKSAAERAARPLRGIVAMAAPGP
ncbi:MAG: hypothetical protein JNK11_08480 [Alphaproteobacteria bacterium]|nr:hypothetical protein [Alphaproteobacteria bacterium]